MITEGYEEVLRIDLEGSQRVFKTFQRFYPKKHIKDMFNVDRQTTNLQLIKEICINLLDDTSGMCYTFAFKPLIVELVTRLISDDSIEKDFTLQFNEHHIVKSSFILSYIAKLIGYDRDIETLVEYFLEKNNFCFEIRQNENKISQNELQSILVSYLRIISYNREKFGRFIDSKLIHEIIFDKNCSNINRLLSIQIEASIISLSEDVKNQMIKYYVDEKNLIGSLGSEKGFNFQLFQLFEAQRLSNLTKIAPLSETFVKGPSIIEFRSEDLSVGVKIVAGILFPHIKELETQRRMNGAVIDFIPIKKSIESLRSLASYLKTSRPVLLAGAEGSGKTFLVNLMGQEIGVNTKDLVKIHLNQQTDPKLLLGTYTSGSKPGTFEWKNGVLTTAVKEGKWVLVEDIDKAPNEVLSILLGLLENKELVIPSRNEVVTAKNGFQLIATMRVTSKSGDMVVPDVIGLRLWEMLKVPELDDMDLRCILVHKFPLLDHFISVFIAMFLKIRTAYNSRKLVILNDGIPPRPASIRDLMRFCKRCNALFLAAGVRSSTDLISDQLKELLFQEALDCFTSFLSSNASIKFLCEIIGNILEIPTSRINLQMNRHTASLTIFDDSITVGRAKLKRNHIVGLHRQAKLGGYSEGSSTFSRTNHSLLLMEKIGVAVSMCEPIVLVGETGTGKTTIVQEMAKLLHKTLTVINVSQQTEVSDLLGGYKPVNAKTLALPIEEDFENLFSRSFSIKKNERFLRLLAKCFNKSQWKNVIRLWQEAYKMAKATFTVSTENNDKEMSRKKKRKLNDTDRSELLEEWHEMYGRIDNFGKQFKNIENSFVFQFVEGALVKAIKNGEWLLLDEVNLASPETLDSISDLLADEIEQRSILLSEKGDIESIKADPEFRIFACMNPATDVGKKNLPLSIRSMLTEIYVHSPDEDINDLLMIIDKYIGKYALSDEWVGNDIAELYLSSKKLANTHQIVDGANQKPQFSIRTLTRTLSYVTDIIEIYGLRRSLYEGFCMSFLTLLDEKSEKVLYPLITKYTIGRLKNANSVMKRIPPNPDPKGEDYVQFRHYWLRKGPEEPIAQDSYIITPFVEKNLLNLVRATSNSKYPILLQGPTSAGKTSMINYLAKITGHKFVRINNHEHTDLQEYLGTYVSDSTGKLSFREGVLVEALRNGYWIVLDELNLAPTDVLEALNRLLDDNRELFIPETQEVVHPHQNFMLFATQNPPGLYGGRKILSKAFRNRFLELHFDDIPQDDLEVILRERCKIAPSHAKRIVEVYRELSVQRQSTRLFEKKNSFATLRDLFRWAERDAVGYEELAANGYMLLAERVRRPEEKLIVKAALEKVMRVKLDMDAYYKKLEDKDLLNMESPVIWTKAMRRLAVLVISSLKHHEPVLLVGETGCGKTTICQLLAHYFGKQLIVVNAHQNIETSDLLGAQRPLRNRSHIQAQLIDAIKKAVEILGVDTSSITSVTSALKMWKDHQNDENLTKESVKLVQSLQRENNTLFEWQDGPLVEAMKKGCFFLLDEISLADDSVLERLNSVLEPERMLLLAEKNSEDALVTAPDSFSFFATMNPGGDYGKKELSPALRNRFTEIWVPSMEDFDDVKQIVTAKLSPPARALSSIIVEFSRCFGNMMGAGNTGNGVISLRDILSWIQFINCCITEGFDLYKSWLQGACMVFIDSLGTHNTSFLANDERKLNDLKVSFVNKLSELTGQSLMPKYEEPVSIEITENKIVLGGFTVDRESSSDELSSFSLDAPTTAANAARVARALLVKKPILLEGSPGVGKTSLICALAKATGKNLTRINLSEQTDLIDLFGSDAPVEGGNVGEFQWRDGPFLKAMQRGDWVLLDEMNLASQSVLEGLNACLDHRGEVYIPELDRSFVNHPSFRVFAAQNPQSQGGGRKGLPKSFVNRFTVVYVDILKKHDLRLIASRLFPSVDQNIRNKLIEFISLLEYEVSVRKSWGSSGQPWEFNLRDVLRWLTLMKKTSDSYQKSAYDFYELVIRNRFRSEEDRIKCDALFESSFGPLKVRDPYFDIHPFYVQTKSCIVKRAQFVQYKQNANAIGLQCNIKPLESVLYCIEMAYPCLLVGPSGSGKTDIIKYSAGIIGAKLLEFSMNNDIDSMDILGGFEQSDPNRLLMEYANDLLSELHKEVSISEINAAKNITCDTAGYIETLLGLIETLSERSLLFEDLKNIVTILKKILLESSNSEICHTIKDMLRIMQSYNEHSSVNFRWFDSLLVRAVEKGCWLVLDNANLCNPSVLDRINSLLEMNGNLVINECSSDDGTVRTIKPHPNFRLFLTCDPKYGELSRAMRNRSVEIFLDRIDLRATSFDRECIGLEAIRDKQDSVFNRFRKLSLSTTIPKPVSCFVDPQDSSTRELAQIIDFFNAMGRVDQSEKDFVLSAISFTEHYMWDSISILLDQEASCTEFSISTTALDEYGSVTSYFKVNNIPDDALFLASENVTTNDRDLMFLTSFQPLLPTLNEYTLQSLFKDRKFAPTSESSYFVLDWLELYKLENIMQKIENRAANGRMIDLNDLEKSAAMNLGRNVKNAPTLPLHMLISHLIAFTKKSLVAGLSSSKFLKQENYFGPIFKFEEFVEQIVKVSLNVDESYLRFYQKNILQWIEDSRCLFDQGNVKLLLDSVKKFTNELELTRGLSISTIWKYCHSQYPSTEEDWEHLRQLVKVSQDFDGIVNKQSPETQNTMLELKRSFAELLVYSFKGDLTSDLLHIEKKINDEIENLKSVTGDFTSDRTQTFKSLFNNILAHWEARNILSKDDMKFHDDTINLAIMGGKSTLDLARFNLWEPFKPYPAILGSLWNEKGDDFATSLFDDGFFSLAFDCIRDSKSLPYEKMNTYMHDLQTAIKELFLKSDCILYDHLASFKQLGVNWVVWICQIHNYLLPITAKTKAQEYLTDISKDSIQKDYVMLLQNNGLSYFASIFESYMRPILLLQNNSLHSIGSSWVLFSFGLLLLYVPNLTFDPAIEGHASYRIYLSLCGKIKSIHDSFVWFRKVKFGDDQLFAETLLPNIEDYDKPEKPQVYRSKDSTAALTQEWNSFLDAYLSEDSLNELLKAAESNEETASMKVNNFEINASQFILRLRDGYNMYSDLNDILCGYIYAMKFGLQLLRESAIQSSQTVNSTLWIADPLVMSSEEQISNAFKEVQQCCRSVSTTNTDADYVYYFFLKLANVLHSESQKGDPNSVLNQSLLSLYYRWSLNSMKQEEAETVNQSIYKFKDPTVNVEEEFLELFPDAEDIVEIDSSEKVTKTNSGQDELYSKIATTYIDIFEKKNVSEKSFNDIIESAPMFLHYFQSINKSVGFGANRPSILLSVISLMSTLSKSLNENLNESEVNFYDFSFAEAKKANEVVTELEGAVKPLIEKWPEQASLQDIKRICQEFLTYPSSTPIYRTLSRVEQIFTYVTQWESYAHSGISLQHSLDKLSSIIVGWRKLELSSWSTVLEDEEKRVIKDSSKWWFYLFETLIVPTSKNNQDDEENNIKVVNALNLFISQASFGDFQFRLELLTAFSRHIMAMLPKSKLSDVLANTVSFYTMFEDNIISSINDTKKTLKKEVSDVIKLASWKDTNIDALKQSSQRSHRSLFKVIRKYREVLAQPVRPLITQGLALVSTSDVKTFDKSFISVSIDKSENIKAILSACHTWNQKSHILFDSTAANARMSNYIQEIMNDQIPRLSEFSGELLAEARHLRKETPSEATSKNKSQCAALKTRKRKLLSDTLKELRRMGLKVHLTTDITNTITSASALLVISKHLPASVKETDKYFWRVIELLPRLRNAVKNVNDEIPTGSAQRGLAAAESLLFSLVASRKMIASVCALFEYLDLWIGDISRLVNLDVSESKMISHVEDPKLDVGTAIRIVNELPGMLSLVQKSMMTASTSLKRSFDTSIFDKLCAQVQTLSFERREIYSVTDFRNLAKLQSFLYEFFCTIDDWKIHNKEVSFAADFVVQWIQESKGHAMKTEKVSDNSLDDIDKSLYSLCLDMVLSVQKIYKIREQVPMPTLEDDKWLRTLQRIIYDKYGNMLNIDSVLSKLKDSILLMKGVDCISSEIMSARISHTLVYVENYRNLVVGILSKMTSNYADLSTALYQMSTILFNISKDGFCSPEPHMDEEEDDTEKMQEGTGLGDGEGAKNNSKDVGSDEDLSEDAERDNTEQGDDEMDSDKDDAVSIEGDMAGKTESLDAEDEENSSDEKDEDDEEDEDDDSLDDEVDDIDDDDPNAIDEKMWGDEADDNSKEKKSDKLPQNSKNDDDQLEAAENEGEDPDKRNLDDTNDGDNDEAGDDEEKNDQSENEDGNEDEVAPNNDDDDDEQVDDNISDENALELPENMQLDGDENETKENEDEEEDEAMQEDEGTEDDNSSANDNGENEMDNEEPGDDEDSGLEDDAETDAVDAGKDTEEDSAASADDNDAMSIDEEGGINQDDSDEGSDNASMDDNEVPEGLEGGEEQDAGNESVDEDAAAHQQEGMKTQGADTATEQQEVNAGNYGGDSSLPQQERNSGEQESNDTKQEMNNAGPKKEQKPNLDRAHEQVNESLKQLGDALKEFHRRRQEINEATRDDLTEQKAGERPDEFQHIDDADSDDDMQAMGSANEDQIQPIDDDMAIDDDQEQDGDATEDHDEEDAKEKKELNSENLEDKSTEKDKEPNMEAGKVEDDTNSEKKNEEMHVVLGKRDDIDETIETGENNKQDLDAENNSDSDGEEHYENLQEAETTKRERSYEEARDLWTKADESTRDLTAGLSEQLRLILEPTLATKLKGDYKTGKRLNMKRIIPYIASQFRKDKIWMRRTKPSKRQYQIMIAVDDSKSMAESQAVDIAFESISLVSKALTQLESGQLAVAKFGSDAEIVHPFEKPFTTESGIEVFRNFMFDETKTNVKALVEKSLSSFREARTYGNADLWQLQIILSDGVCEDHEELQRLVRKAREDKIMIVFVVIDCINNEESILDMNQVNYIPDSNGQLQLKVTRYLDTFPFDYYSVVHNIKELPEMLGLILRQYFSEISSV